MKSILHRSSVAFIMMIVALTTIHTQVVINEISYNPPESGTDSLEFIELFNAGNAMVNIGGWYFETGVEDTLPNIDLQPGEYFVTAGSAQAMMNVYGIAVHEWGGNALSNNGELIKLVDGGGNLVDSVLYDDGDPWPSAPDGNGPSLELVDSALDNNDGANWQFSGGTTGVIINGFEVSGTPGVENSDGGSAGPAVTVAVGNFQFNPKHIVVETGDVVRWINAEAISHNVNGSQTTFPNNPASFTSGAPAPNWTYDLTTTAPGLYDYRCDPHAGGGMVGTMSVYDPMSYTDFPFDQLRLTDGTNGQHIYDGVPTTVTGVVHGVNFQPTGYSFYVIDENNVGINVFSFDPGAYVVTEGDELKVWGVIDQFNGLLEIIPDSIEVLSIGNTLNTTRHVTELTEADESSYLYLDELGIDSVGGISAAGFNIYTTHKDGAKVLVRVDADANTGKTPEDFPEGAWLYVWRGIGTQFDSSFPFTGGYQVLALELDLFVDGIEFLDKTAINMQPNPAMDWIQLNGEYEISQVDIYSLDGKKLLSEKVGNQNTQIKIDALPVGLHVVRAITDEGIWTSLLSVMR